MGEICITEPPPEPTPTYPNLDPELEQLALALEKGIFPRWSLQASLYRASQLVNINLSSNLEAVIDWLESRDVYLYSVHQSSSGSTISYARVPVSLLGALSEQKGVTGVSTTELWFQQNYGWRGITEGEDDIFLMFTNAPDPPGVRVVINHSGDTGNLSFGSCPGPEEDNRSFSNGDVVTFKACAPGAVWAKLHMGEESGRWYEINVLEERKRPAYLSPIPEAMKAGESRTFTLNTVIPNPPGVKISVNNEVWGNPGNLAIGECPGELNEGVILEDGDTVTVTACVPGRADIDLLYQGSLPDDDLLPGYKGNMLLSHSLSVWEE